MIAQMNPRERVLAGIVAAVVFIFFNAFVIDYFLKNRTRLRGELAKNSGALLAMKRQLAEKPMWEQRDAWLQSKQPKLAAEDRAGVELLDAVTEIGRKHTVTLVNQSLRLPSFMPEYASISVDIETTSTWAALIGFLGEVQGPGQFIVFEGADLKIDDKDATMMHGNFKVAKWFAPKPKPK